MFFLWKSKIPLDISKECESRQTNGLSFPFVLGWVKFSHWWVVAIQIKSTLVQCFEKSVTQVFIIKFNWNQYSKPLIYLLIALKRLNLLY